MDRAGYIKYLRDQAYWLNELADDIDSSKSESQWCRWAVDFSLLRPEEVLEKEERLTA